ncbi:MAG: riboflavin biosynthesis protein RibF [bacterium]|nr:riboflavin biosynthesis protein RibF [bacterium]
MRPDVRVYRSLEEVPPSFGPAALTIGNFDGVHVGHREIMRRVVKLARKNGWQPSALTFHPHPASVVAPEYAPRLLSKPDERCEWMGELGIVQVVIVPFTVEFSYLSPQEFAERVLVGKLGARAVMVGANFRFGRQKGGDTGKLRALGDRLGFQTEIVEGIRFRGHMVSSSEIRRLITAGNVALAGRFLGRVVTLTGDVVPGHGIGSRQTVPTLNLDTGAEVLPGIGVYVTRTVDPDGGRQWGSVTNVGQRPTFDGGNLTIETHLLDPLTGDPPPLIRVEFLRRLRGEKKFAAAADLKEQILRDAENARTYLRRARRWMQATRGPDSNTRSDVGPQQ